MRSRSLMTLAGLFAVMGVMVGLVSYSVTLYRLFCEYTGAGGTTQRVAGADGVISDRFVTVIFDANITPGLPWKFRPMQRSVRLRLGETALIFYEAENLTDRDLVGHATFNVTPEKSGAYFKKIECFCFTEEKLGARERVEMPVQFFVDPALAEAPNTRDVTQITLSYTFFPSLKPEGAEDLARFRKTADAEAGKQLFAAECSTCHAAESAKIGPALAGVFGRRSGTAPGYPSSPALVQAAVIWDETTLDRWLAGPREMVPGVLMPQVVKDAADRSNIIAYLRSLSPARAAEQSGVTPKG